MIFVFYFFAALLILLSVKSLISGFAYLRFFKSEIAKPTSQFTPFVTVFAPCRGLDFELGNNLEALFELDYPEYEIIFVVDDLADPAVKVINEILERRGYGRLSEANRENLTALPIPASSSPQCKKVLNARLVTAERSTKSGQKVENLRHAVLHASPDSKGFVFVDSDARPSPDWLRSLVAPLENENVGAATGYRWFIAKRPSLASELRSAWNASIASALGPNTSSNFCWGGSMAISRHTFERLNIRSKWEGSLSDDFTVTRVMNEAKLPIVFVPKALTASVENCTLAQMFRFTNRQMKITHVYARRLWVTSLLGSALFNVVMITAAIIAISGSRNIVAFYVALVTFLTVSICSTAKAWLRLSAVTLALPEHKKSLKMQHYTQNTLWVVTPAIFLFNAVMAGFSRRVTWRGTVYELISPTETVIIAD